MKNLLASYITIFCTTLTFTFSEVSAAGKRNTAKKYMISAANPYAVNSGLEILREGGSAADAAIAAQMILTLVEPQSSGIGGGAFLLHYQPQKLGTDKNLAVHAYDGRETAPISVKPNLFIDKDGKKIPWQRRKAGGKGVGVPGLLRMLELVHMKHGKLPWKRLFLPAIRLANKGFPVSSRLHTLIKRDKHLKNFPKSRSYFYLEEGKPLPVGHKLKNKILSDTLYLIAEKGAKAFYSGPIARDIVNAIKNTHHLPAEMAVNDLTNYKAKLRKVIRSNYRQWQIYGMPPPSSGGVAVAQILTMLERFDLSRIPARSVRSVHLISEASKIAFADRNFYLADPDFTNVPVDGLLDRTYLSNRSKLISPLKALGKVKPGIPPSDVVPNQSADLGDNRPVSTTHISVVDGEGNAVSMTSSIGTAFGSRLMVRGFMLNDELSDFAAIPSVNGNRKANRAYAGKRPRSSMAPTIITNKQGKLVMVIGSPGGSSIIGYVVKTIIAALDWRMNLQDSIALPNFVNKNRKTELEKGTYLENFALELQRLGHKIKIKTKNSGLHGIRGHIRGYEGGADPRREGLAIGD